ncbi:cellulose synthase operon protein YhjQ/BcsQ [Novosphingobium colocasiae]|uniref:ATPase n=1 Tax=Novosphingobium colocasiae TaxID=1256513 RepID=A0A918PCW4_9SPHN|nr:cellulose synthase operon protein YhjQ/BcsQ [Novosphingobium colocasiae]GGZ00652.1 hypothetical protein GCM10011614_14640 [Novosphingobium colocasiae]
MALLLCHSSKGGTGNTFVAAHLALALVEHGADVTLLSTAAMDSLPLHFGLPPSTRLPGFNAGADRAVVASGISLRNDPRAPADPDFAATLRDLGFLDNGDRVLVLDVAAGDLGLARALLPLARAHVCTLPAAPESLSLLPDYLDIERGCWSDHSVVAINMLDETRKLTRHTAAFLRELLGARLVGRVRRDEAVPEALASLQYLSRYAPASAALADVAALARAVAPMLERPTLAEQIVPGRSWIA